MSYETSISTAAQREQARKGNGYSSDTDMVKAGLDNIKEQVADFCRTKGDRVNEFAERLQDMEQRVASQNHGAYMTSFTSPLFDTAEVAASRDFQRLQAHEKGAGCTIKLEQKSVKALFNNNGDADTGNTLYPTQPDRLATYIGPQRPLSLFDVLPVIPTASNAVEFVRLTLGGEAGVQPGEGELKQETEFGAELETSRIETVAVWSGVSAQCLADTGTLLNAVGGLLRNAVRDKSEQQLFVGSGVGSGFFITGLYTGSIPLVTYEDSIPDRIGRAITTMESAGYQPSVIALNPSDWFSISILKDADGNYIYGNPASPARPSLWNRPVLVSASVPAGTALIIDSSKVAILDREQPSLYLTRDHLDFAVRNMVLVLAEMRLGLAVYDVNAVRKVDLTAAT